MPIKCFLIKKKESKPTLIPTVAQTCIMIKTDNPQ